ncbi:MAG: S41 family peptidase [Bacteroidales bacterium]|nr:S41 family peptidase [Bacteroidales bacterium]
MKKIFIVAISLCFSLNAIAQNADLKSASNKMVKLMWMIENAYVDSTDIGKITEEGIKAMLKELDPHSTYIPKSDVQKMNEPLQGNIIGIGVTFQILNDTIHVIDVVADGPADKVGMYPGDKILKVNDTIATGKEINNDWVTTHLRGKKGTKVRIVVERNGKGELTFEIIRDKIPLNSIDTWFMIDKEIGYVSLRRFAQTSRDELVAAIDSLKQQGMKKLIFDLRSNGGGYLDAAFKICEEFLPKDKLVVYTEGLHQSRQEFVTSSNKGVFEKGALVILTDEYTASASEITSGAVQDWERGVIVGRRTFGKGLVQRPINLDDGSQVRLTTARYYIPSGRCIQKPYADGTEEYYKDYQKRYSHGEMVSIDSISFPDSLKYQTMNGRTVYGGGGIMPDIFVPMDTTKASSYFVDLRSKNIFNDFSINFVESKREELLKELPKFEDFDKAWPTMNIMQEFTKFAEEKGITPKENDTIAQEIIDKSNLHIELTVKGFIARNLYGTKFYYKTIQNNDETLQKAIELIRDEKQYKKILKN